MEDLLCCTVLRHPDDQRSYEAAISENPINASVPSTARRQKRALASHSRLWAPGRTLRIASKPGTPLSHQEAVFEAGSQWLTHANLKFELTKTWRLADIRIETHPTAKALNNAYIGTDALLIRGTTLNLSVQKDHKRFQNTVLHEFGHALGLEHEHQHPDNDIAWDLENLIAYGRKKGLSAAFIQDNYLRKISRTGALIGPYDPGSIMHYRIPAGLTQQNLTNAGSDTLSEGDIALIAKAYPGKDLI